jgi:hypothetical protein
MHRWTAHLQAGKRKKILEYQLKIFAKIEWKDTSKKNTTAGEVKTTPSQNDLDLVGGLTW